MLAAQLDVLRTFRKLINDRLTRRNTLRAPDAAPRSPWSESPTDIAPDVYARGKTGYRKAGRRVSQCALRRGRSRWLRFKFWANAHQASRRLWTTLMRRPLVSTACS